MVHLYRLIVALLLFSPGLSSALISPITSPLVYSCSLPGNAVSTGASPDAACLSAATALGWNSGNNYGLASGGCVSPTVSAGTCAFNWQNSYSGNPGSATLNWGLSGGTTCPAHATLNGTPTTGGTCSCDLGYTDSGGSCVAGSPVNSCPTGTLLSYSPLTGYGYPSHTGTIGPFSNGYYYSIATGNASPVAQLCAAGCSVTYYVNTADSNYERYTVDTTPNASGYYGIHYQAYYQVNGDTCTGSNVNGSAALPSGTAPTYESTATGNNGGSGGGSTGSGDHASVIPAGAVGSNTYTLCNGVTCQSCIAYYDAQGHSIPNGVNGPNCVTPTILGSGIGGTSTFTAGDCSGGGPACTGDAVVCAIATQARVSFCAAHYRADGTPLFDAAVAAGDGNLSASMPGASTVTFSSSSFDTTDALAGWVTSNGLPDLHLTVWGAPIDVPFQTINTWLSRLGSLAVAVTFLLCIRIVSRG